ncbi:MAG: amidophosphoribosyltransferase [Bacillota bacterium]|nr:amidophosphoribosyltransferase [Bacillota bacterium]
MSEEVKEACGVMGFYNNDHWNLPKDLYYGIFALQHRGQESCGMSVCKNGAVSYHKDMGLANEVFSGDVIDKLQGDIGIAHCRYSTTGDSEKSNAQPLVMSFVKGTLSLAHNGNLVDAGKIRQDLMEKQGAIFHTTLDSEIFAYLIAREEVQDHVLESAVRKATEMVSGSYALLVMSPEKLVGIRDPLGIKPLCLGMKGKSYILASESCAIDAIGGVFIRDIEPGELIVIDKDGVHSHPYEGELATPRPCIFEYIYFARPDSVLDGQSIYLSRHLAGKILAERYPVEADVVIAVPDSGIDAAIGYSEESGIPYGVGLIKNRYIGRTFIQPVQVQREEAVRIKLNALRHTVDGKRVVLVDDSMVRGTTSASIIKMLKKAGAKEVHMRISAPPFVWPCFFGIDLPEKKQLTACNHTIEEIRQLLDADSLGFFKIEDLPRIVPNCRLKGFCDACFSGDYPVPVTVEED